MKNQNFGGKNHFWHVLFVMFASTLLIGCSGSPTTATPIPSEPPKPATSESTPPISNHASVNNPPQRTESPAAQGLWSMKSAFLAGNEMPKSVTDTISLEITGINYMVKVGQGIDKGTSEIDATVTPKRMKIVGTEGPNAGKTLLAVVEFPSQEEMKICYDLSGKEYPASFESTAENGYYLVTYGRAAK